jgi:hypothetical protein
VTASGAWVIDTCMLIDVLDDDPDFGRSSARILDHRRGDGLVICPVTYVELAPAFEGNGGLQEEFLAGVGVDFLAPWTHADSLAAHAGWQRHVLRRRRGDGGRRPVADVMIGAFALRFQGLLTRNREDFQANFPALNVVAR